MCPKLSELWAENGASLVQGLNGKYLHFVIYRELVLGFLSKQSLVGILLEELGGRKRNGEKLGKDVHEWLEIDTCALLWVQPPPRCPCREHPFSV